MSNIIPIELKDIDYQDRTYIFRHDFEVGDLENSIQFEGLLYSPILCRPNDHQQYIIISGYRRLLACRNLGKTTVPCIIYQANETSNEELLKISIAENTKRKNLKPIEISEALLRIKQNLNLNVEQLAAQFGETFEIGKDPLIVEKYLRLNLLDNETKDFFSHNTAKDIEFEVANIEKDDDRKTIIDFIKKNNNIKKNQLHKVIDKVEHLKEKEKVPNYRGIFQENALRQILENEEQIPKKINHFLAELDGRLDPDRKAKQTKLEQLIKEFNSHLTNEYPDLNDKINLKKTRFNEKKLKITLEIEKINEMADLMQLLIKQREIINNLIKL